MEIKKQSRDKNFTELILDYLEINYNWIWYTKQKITYEMNYCFILHLEKWVKRWNSRERCAMFSICEDYPIHHVSGGVWKEKLFKWRNWMNYIRVIFNKGCVQPKVKRAFIIVFRYVLIREEKFMFEWRNVTFFTLLVEKNIIFTSPFNGDKRISEIVILSSSLLCSHWKENEHKHRCYNQYYFFYFAWIGFKLIILF